MASATRELKWIALVAACAAGASCLSPVAWSQVSHPEPVTGVIDGVQFEGDQYYVHGWASQEGQRGSIAVHIYANGPAGGKPPGTFVTGGPANLSNETAVDRQ